MDGDSRYESCEKKDDIPEPGENSDSQSHAGNLFSAFWLRRPVCVNNEMDRFLLDYGCNFLFYLGLLFWSLFLLIG